MSVKNKKQFGVWMDSHHATIVGREDTEEGNFSILGHVDNSKPEGNSNEHTSNNHEIALTQRFFKEIAAKMPNIDEIHVTGTGQIQEEFIKFLAGTAQYKNAVSTDSTSTRMHGEQMVAFFSEQFN